MYISLIIQIFSFKCRWAKTNEKWHPLWERCLYYIHNLILAVLRLVSERAEILLLIHTMKGALVTD